VDGGFSNIIAEVQRRVRLGKQSKPVRVKVLGDFSHLYLMNDVRIQVPPDRIVEVGEEDAIALTARGFQGL